MNPHRAALAVLFALSLTACGTPIPPWSKDYAAASTSRSYAAIPPERALAAAKAVLHQAGRPRDIQIADSASGFTAHRYYVAFRGLTSVTGDYIFTLTAQPQGKGSTVRLTLADRSQPGRSGFFDGPDIGLTSGVTIQIRDPYTLFFARMDYVLGLRPDWVTCAAAPAALGAALALDPLCTEAEGGPPPPRL